MSDQNNEELKNILGNLDNLLSQTDLKDVTSEGNGFQDLPDGYYLGEVEKAELTISKKSREPMVAFQFKIIEDGRSSTEDGEFVPLKGTKNRKIFIYYLLKDDSSIKRFVTDMLKFEGEEAGVPLLEKEYFTNSALIEDALDVLVGRAIYIQVSTNEKDDGSKSTWNNMISWKRAEKIGLMD